MTTERVEDEHDLAVEPPARIAILGAGPIGVEAALYARYLGYDVVLIEAGTVAANVDRWGHVRMTTPFARNHSSLGLAALRAQDSTCRLPAEDAVVSGRQWNAIYVGPLARTDLIADHLISMTRVINVECVAVPAVAADVEGADTLSRSGRFRILTQSENGSEGVLHADVVVDATGVSARPRGCGADGMPAVGERALAAQIEYDVPDIAGRERSLYASTRTLVVGADIRAAHTVRALARLAGEEPATRVLWATGAVARSAEILRLERQLELAEKPAGPWLLASRMHELFGDDLFESGQVVDWFVESISLDEANQTFAVQFDGQDKKHMFDRVIVNTRRRADWSICANLHLTPEPMFQAVAPLTDVLRANDLGSMIAMRAWRNWLVTSEPHYYIIGAKSFGYAPGFSFAIGLQQIRALFQIIGGRDTLDLYAAAAP